MIRHYLTLCKPRVVLLMLLTAAAGMVLAATYPIPLLLWINTMLGIACIAASAAACNHILDRHTDALMTRTRKRPLVQQAISLKNASLFAFVLGVAGFFILYFGVNPLTSFLTLGTAFGYACIYSIYLKHETSQNIVIGGLFGAMPPLLGWVAVSNRLDSPGWILVLIIFTWTPAHFWALCLNRYEEYQKTDVPMLPITHGIPFTKWQITVYSLLTALSSLLPYAMRMSGSCYLWLALALNIGLLFYAIQLQRAKHIEKIALKLFRYSLLYLSGIFIALLFDHAL